MLSANVLFLLGSERATARRIREVTILQEFFSECGDPPLEVIGSEDEFLTWYHRSKRATPADRVVRMFRLVWKFALQLEITHDDCPWKSVDFSKGRLQMEAVDVVDAFAPSQLKDLTQELLGISQTDSLAYRCANSAAHREQFRSELSHAKDRSVTALRACGRLDLVRPVFQLDLESLLALLDVPHLASVRPPGRILLGHERAIALRSLRAKSDHLKGAIGQADEPAAVGQSDNLPEEGVMSDRAITREDRQRAIAIPTIPSKPIFLTLQEVAELTGIKIGRRGKNREQLQTDWLRESGIPFWTNARGRPIIARAAIEGRTSEQEATPKKWHPKVLTLR